MLMISRHISGNTFSLPIILYEVPAIGHKCTYKYELTTGIEIRAETTASHII